jgi:hypothetical protein
MYAHRCQACIRLYTDPAVRRVVRDHYEEKIADVMCAEWLLYHHTTEGDATGTAPNGPQGAERTGGDF